MRGRAHQCREVDGHMPVWGVGEEGRKDGVAGEIVGGDGTKPKLVLRPGDVANQGRLV